MQHLAPEALKSCGTPTNHNKSILLNTYIALRQASRCSSQRDSVVKAKQMMK